MVAKSQTPVPQGSLYGPAISKTVPFELKAVKVVAPIDSLEEGGFFKASDSPERIVASELEECF